MAQALERGSTRVQGFQNPEMDHQLMRQLGSIRYGGASVGECLALAARIRDADPASWVQAFADAGRWQSSDAAMRARNGFAISARDQYLVACNSYRAAEYYCAVDDARHQEYGQASRQAFLWAMQWDDARCTELWFSQNGLRLPAYHIRGARSVGDRMLMIVSGFDGTLEESYLTYGVPALQRGYDLLLFTGPGQMDTWRFNQDSPFAPDFEVVGRQAVDYALAQPGMDPRHLALMGISFGGYFATRIAAYEPRIRALIANSPIVDLHAYMTSFIGLDPATLPASDDFGIQDLPNIPDSVMNAQTREMSRNLMLRFGRPSFVQTYQRIADFRLDAAQLAGIRCPSLALVGEGEGAEPKRQWQLFQDSVGGPSAQWLFTAQEGADAHCQVGNLAYSAAVTMDWLAGALTESH
ncbi:MAG TPA: prolyl oligopeptidase family serine peptidase [Castellaniella sp.]|nr:prolyl oligopeptidase family serine peptidase [Castellaniella sp.]